MKRTIASISTLPTVPKISVGLIFLICATFSIPCMAVSDTDVHIIKAMDVLIEKDKLTITAQAITTLRTISHEKALYHQGRQLFGRPSNTYEVMSDSAKFVVHKPTADAQLDLWKKCVKAADKLKEGKPTGRIAFYRPKVVIRENLIVEITGYGYLIPNPERIEFQQNRRNRGIIDDNNPATSLWHARWKVIFSNGKHQFYRFNKDNTAATVKSNSRSSIGKVDILGNQASIGFNDDRFEKWTLAGNQAVVEHWTSNRQEGEPMLGIGHRLND